MNEANHLADVQGEHLTSVPLRVKFFYSDSLEASVDVLTSTFLLVLGATPPLNVLTYLRASIAVHNHPQAVQPLPNRWHALGWLSFVAAWAASWKIAVDMMLVEYAQLPTTDPNCYVGSAAAHGHGRFVGTDRPTFGSAVVPLVNMQMRRLPLPDRVIGLHPPHGS
ncbi:MAG: hypothetical protein ACYC3X_31470 [Pirellulaceae bacterium]